MQGFADKDPFDEGRRHEPGFDGERCDRIVHRVLARIDAPAAHPAG